MAPGGAASVLLYRRAVEQSEATHLGAKLASETDRQVAPLNTDGSLEFKGLANGVYQVALAFEYTGFPKARPAKSWCKETARVWWFA